MLPPMNDSFGLGLVVGTAFVTALWIGWRGGARRYPAFWRNVSYELDQDTARIFRMYWGADTTNEAIVRRVKEFQQKALQVVNYPCIQRFNFAKFRLIEHKAYTKYVAANVASAAILDIGCMMGTDLRGVIACGGDVSKLVGIELETPFIDLGLQFFGDGDRPGVKTMLRQGNVLEDGAIDKAHLCDLKGRFDFIFTGSILHLFNYQDQCRLFDFMDKALKPEGGIVFGNTTGRNPPGEGMNRDLHSVESLAQMLQGRGYSDIEVFELPAPRELVGNQLNTPHAGNPWLSDQRIWISFTYRCQGGGSTHVVM